MFFLLVLIIMLIYNPRFLYPSRDVYLSIEFIDLKNLVPIKLLIYSSMTLFYISLFLRLTDFKDTIQK